MSIKNLYLYINIVYLLEIIRSFDNILRLQKCPLTQKQDSSLHVTVLCIRNPFELVLFRGSIGCEWFAYYQHLPPYSYIVLFPHLAHSKTKWNSSSNKWHDVQCLSSKSSPSTSFIFKTIRRKSYFVKCKSKSFNRNQVQMSIIHVLKKSCDSSKLYDLDFRPIFLDVPYPWLAILCSFAAGH